MVILERGVLLNVDGVVVGREDGTSGHQQRLKVDWKGNSKVMNTGVQEVIFSSLFGYLLLVYEFIPNGTVVCCVDEMMILLFVLLQICSREVKEKADD
ncbi:unnamed protein product [Vicia faba]|uniref:Uncharacterized protein n=1 Tax=Vicia faba TaxID=3906 RepID=A0AAV1B9H1_VICFA|nr:unnamed protein product [Vicia faba]